MPQVCHVTIQKSCCYHLPVCVRIIWVEVLAWLVIFNPLTPKSDWYLISPHNFNPESRIKVMRIKEAITN